LYVFLYLLLLQTSCSLFQDSLFHFGPFATVFRTPYLLHPSYLYIHHSTLDHISVNLSLFRAPHSLAIVAARVCRRQAGLYIWFQLFPLLDVLVFILPWTLDLSRGICAPSPPFLPFLFAQILFRLTVRQQTKPPCCRSSVTYCCCLVTLYR
jgi:hypothetical protein